MKRERIFITNIASFLFAAVALVLSIFLKGCLSRKCATVVLLRYYLLFMHEQKVMLTTKKTGPACRNGTEKHPSAVLVV